MRPTRVKVPTVLVTIATFTIILFQNCGDVLKTYPPSESAPLLVQTPDPNLVLTPSPTPPVTPPVATPSPTISPSPTPAPMVCTAGGENVPVCSLKQGASGLTFAYSDFLYRQTGLYDRMYYNKVPNGPDLPNGGGKLFRIPTKDTLATCEEKCRSYRPDQGVRHCAFIEARNGNPLAGSECLILTEGSDSPCMPNSLDFVPWNGDAVLNNAGFYRATAINCR